MIISNKNDLEICLNWINKTEFITYDVETNSLNKRTGKIIGFGISDTQTAFYIPIYVWNKNTQTLDYLPNYANEVLQKLQDKNLYAFNGAFDILFTKLDLKIDLTEALHTDGLLLSHSTNENLFSYKLKDIAAREFGKHVLGEQDDLKASIEANGGTKNEFYKADLEILAKYCMQDCILTHKLIDRYLPYLRADGLEKFFYEQETMMLYKHVTLPMEEQGIRLDIPYVQATQSEILADIKALEEKIQEQILPHLQIFEDWFLNKDYPPSRTGAFAQAYASFNNLPLPKTKAGALSLTEKAIQSLPESHPKQVLLKQEMMHAHEIRPIQLYMWAQENQGASRMFNLKSGHHLKKLFFDTLQEIPLSRTPTGQPQCDDEFLDLMAKKYEWAEDLRTYRRLNKLESTYITRFLDAAEGDRFYPSWKQHGTVTGRFSGDMQQLPRKLEEGETDKPVILKYTNKIRDFFIADEDSVLIDADYESLEPHFFSHYSEDPALLQIFKDNLDFYSTIAIKTEKLEGVSPDKKAPNYLGKLQKPKRQSAKKYALGIAYGEEDWKLHIELGVPQDEAKKLVKGYWDGFPVLYKKSEDNKKFICKNGFIASEFGRLRRLPEARQIYQEHGYGITDSLQLWKDYHELPGVYEKMKKKRKILKKCLNAAINFPTQSGSASVVNRSGIALAKAYKAAGIPAVLVANIHDEWLVSCKKGYEIVAAQMMQSCLETTVPLRLALKAEPVIGFRYGELK